MKLSACLAAMALAFGAAHAWTFDASEVTPPDDIVGEHQPLQRTWTISSFAQLEQLYLAVPGRVFVELDPSLLPATEAPATEGPDVSHVVPGVVAGVTPGVVAGTTPGVVPGFVPGETPVGSEAASTEAPATEGPGVPHVVPGVVAGVTPGVVAGTTPGVVPGFVPGEAPVGSEAAGTEAPATEGPGVPHVVPGVVAGVTPGVVAGTTPGVVPGFVPGEAPVGSEAAGTEAPATEGPGVPHVVPGVVAGVTPGVVAGTTPGVVPGFVPGEAPVGSEAAGTEAPATEGPGVPHVVPGVVAGVTPGVVAGTTPGVVPGFVPGEAPVGSEAAGTEAPATEGPGVPHVVPGVVAGTTPGVVPGFVPGEAPVGTVAGSGLDSNDISLVSETIEIPTMMLRKHHHRHHDNEDEDEQQGEETVVARIVITGNSTDLINMIEAAPLHPRRNDGLKLHLKNEDAYAEGYVLTYIYVFEKNLLRRVTTAFSGDVVLNDDVVTLDDAEADVKFACVGDANLYLESSTNATLASLEVEVTGNGLAQLEIPSVNLGGDFNVEVAGSGAVALITSSLTADDVKTTLSGSGNIVVDTSDLEAQKLDAAVYGSGVASFATVGSVDKETLTLSGPGQLLAGSIVARKSDVDVWGDGDMLVQVTDRLTVSTSVWGKVGYVNAPPTDVKIKGWWFWREASSIVYPAAVNKVLIYEPATVPSKHPVYYSIETAESALSDDPDYAFVSAESANVANLMTTSLSSVEQTAAASTGSQGLFYAFFGVGVVVVNVVAARSWAQRRVRRHYTRLL
uniref:Putative auto-transporter adhesin head GIN domain-containing protein n=1 Tax=Phytophthora ramorum TaxID=164328 RepID=H3GPQ3_PHYRM